MIRIVIELDMNTGAVQINGPIDEPRIMHFALGESLRLVNERTTARDKAVKNGSGLVVAHQLPSP